MNTILLAIESSCDDTAAAVIIDGKVISNVTAAQSIHEQYGGVVPEVASRAHHENIVPVVDQAILRAGINKHQIHAVAFTRGPGLVGSLLVGVSFAKALALALGVPLLEVHHMQAHVLAHFAEDPHPEFPFLCLTVSGGHTQIVLVKDYFDMEIVGETLDDAAGEAFDKTGKMLGLGYPAGPQVDRLAQAGTARFDFPEPQIPGYNFSFSGLKTSVLYFLKKQVEANPDFIADNLADICASIQQRIVSILLKKLSAAAKDYRVKHLAIAGGVSANSGLRSGFVALGRSQALKTFIPKFEYCTDNAAMIGIAGYFKFLKGEFAPQSTAPLARWELGKELKNGEG